VSSAIASPSAEKSFCLCEADANPSALSHRLHLKRFAAASAFHDEIRMHFRVSAATEFFRPSHSEQEKIRRGPRAMHSQQCSNAAAQK
jgi:hypothetical protein